MFDGVSPQCEMYGIAAPAMQKWLPKVRPHLEKMANGSNGRFATEDLVQSIENRDMQLWIALDGAEIICALVTSIRRYPRKAVLCLHGISGRHYKRWAHYLAWIEEWGRSQGAVAVESLIMAPKFLHIMPGYKVDHILVGKDL